MAGTQVFKSHYTTDETGAVIDGDPTAYKATEETIIYLEDPHATANWMHDTSKLVHDALGVPFRHDMGGKRKSPRIGRNEPCHCGSGKKFKRCCSGKENR